MSKTNNGDGALALSTGGLSQNSTLRGNWAMVFYGICRPRKLKVTSIRIPIL